MKKLFIFSSLFTALAASAQIDNASFESWSNLYPHAYEPEMIAMQVVNPTHGELDGWSFDSPWGISRTTDAPEGNYAVIVHNWYNYVETTLTYRGTTDEYPTSLSGMYKYVTGNPGENATGRVIVLSTAGDTIINEFFQFGTEVEWATFNQSLSFLQTPIDLADSLILHFNNATTSCVGGNMVCNLLYLDKMSLETGSNGIDESTTDRLQVFPNPAKDQLTLVNTSLNAASRWEIVDIQGALHLSGTMPGTSVEIGIQNLAKGSYLIRLRDEYHVLAYQKLVIL